MNPIRWLGAVITCWMAAAAPWAQAEPVRLQYWHAYSGKIGELHEELIHTFNEAHQHIQVVPIYGGSLWTMRDKLASALVAGTPPAVASIDQFWIAQLADGGHVEPMENLRPGTTRELIDGLLPLLRDSVAYQGRYYGVPFANSTVVMYYNRDLLKELGLDSTDVPATWADLKQLASDISPPAQSGIQNRLWMLGLPTRAQTGVAYYFIITLWQHGGEIFSDSSDRVDFDSADGIRSLKLWRELVELEILDLNRPSTAWEAGRLLFQIGSSAHLASTYADLPFEVGIAPLPYGDRRATGLGGRTLVILANEVPEREAALEFIGWLTSPEVNQQWSAATGYLPSRDESYSHQVHQDLLSVDPRWEVMINDLAYARLRPNVAVYGDVSRILGEAIEQVLYRQVDPAEALRQAADEANSLIQRYQQRSR